VSSYKVEESEKPVTDQSLIREVFPSHGPKRLAHLMMVPVNTARHWCYRRLSAARRHELALMLLAEMNEQDRRRAEVRRQLEAIAHGESAERMGDPSGGEVDRVAGGDPLAPGYPAAGAGDGGKEPG